MVAVLCSIGSRDKLHLCRAAACACRSQVERQLQSDEQVNRAFSLIAAVSKRTVRCNEKQDETAHDETQSHEVMYSIYHVSAAVKWCSGRACAADRRKPQDTEGREKRGDAPRTPQAFATHAHAPTQFDKPGDSRYNIATLLNRGFYRRKSVPCESMQRRRSCRRDVAQLIPSVKRVIVLFQKRPADPVFL